MDCPPCKPAIVSFESSEQLPGIAPFQSRGVAPGSSHCLFLLPVPWPYPACLPVSSSACHLRLFCSLICNTVFVSQSHLTHPYIRAPFSALPRPVFAPACHTVARPLLCCILSACSLRLPLVLIRGRWSSSCRCAAALHRECGVAVCLCGAITWLGTRSVRNARQQTSRQPATCRYRHSGVRPAAHSCPAVAKCFHQPA